MQELLLHHDQRAASGGAAQSPAPPAFGVRLSVACPKLGLALDLRRSAADGGGAAAEAGAGAGVGGAAAGSGSYERARCVILALHAARLEAEPGGALSLGVEDLVCGSCARATAPVQTTILAAPSTVCHRVCKAAEFFRYSVVGTIFSESWRESPEEQARFLTVRVEPRWGSGGLAVDGGPSPASPRPSAAAAAGAPLGAVPEWRPGGQDVSIRVAAVGARYEPSVFSALLDFADAWDSARDAPWLWAQPELALEPTAATAAAAAACAASAPPPLPASPVPLAELVLHTFSVHRIPALGELWLPAADWDLHCPGVALSLPYEHRRDGRCARPRRHSLAAHLR